MKKNITISDIAKSVGVSKTTISRYLNGHFEYMSQETREKIEKEIAKTNYDPSSLARGLKSKRSSLIGIVANTLQYQVAAQFVRGIHDVCVDNGYGTIISSSDNILLRETNALRTCLRQQVDGIALVPANLNCDYYTQIYESGTPIVMCNRYRSDWKYDGVYVDNVALTRRALQQMIDNGYTKIALFLDEDQKESNKKYREQIFIEFATQHCGVDGRSLIYQVANSAELVQQSISDFMASYPNERKAIFAINTSVLFLTLRALKMSGLVYPKDIGVCGYDLVGWSELVDVTSLDHPFYNVGVIAGRQLIKRINQELIGEPDEIWLQGNIHFRRSTESS